MTLTEGEARIVELARALFAQVSEPELRGMLDLQHKTPPQLSPDGMAALQESLATGAALFFARAGAWRKEGGARLWERAALPPLSFTSASFEFLRWVLGIGPRVQQAPLLPTRHKAANGDELLLVAALATTHGTPWQLAIAFQPLVRESALCAAGFAFELGMARALDEAPAFDLSPGGWQALALEGLADLFAQSWTEAEAHKRHEQVPALLLGGSQAQGRVLEALLAAARAPERRAALSFLVEASKRVLDGSPAAQAYGLSLSTRTTLRERSEARAASGSFLRGMLSLAALDTAHRETRFTDDGYDAAQALVLRWEAVGPTRAQWATVEPTLSALGSA